MKMIFRKANIDNKLAMFNEKNAINKSWHIQNNFMLALKIRNKVNDFV